MSPYICDKEFDDEEYDALVEDIINTFKAYSRDDIDEIDEIKFEVIDLYLNDCDTDYLKTILDYFEVDIYDALMDYRDKVSNDFHFKNKQSFYACITFNVIYNNLTSGNSINADYIDEEIKKYLDDSNDSNDS